MDDLDPKVILEDVIPPAPPGAPEPTIIIEEPPPTGTYVPPAEAEIKLGEDGKPIEGEDELSETDALLAQLAEKDPDVYAKFAEFLEAQEKAAAAPEPKPEEPAAQVVGLPPAEELDANAAIALRAVTFNAEQAAKELAAVDAEIRDLHSELSEDIAALREMADNGENGTDQYRRIYNSAQRLQQQIAAKDEAKGKIAERKAVQENAAGLLRAVDEDIRAYPVLRQHRGVILGMINDGSLNPMAPIQAKVAAINAVCDRNGWPRVGAKAGDKKANQAATAERLRKFQVGLGKRGAADAGAGTIKGGDRKISSYPPDSPQARANARILA